MKYNKKNVASMIDHTFLKPDGSISDIKKLCQEAKEYDFASVAIAPDFVKLCAKKLADTSVDIDVAIGFPLGYTTTETKVFETKNALENGATEVDMVVNIVAVKDKRWDYVKNDIKAVAKETKDIIFKVIFETCYLNKDEIKKLAQICSEIKEVDFIKTSTGFGTEGATVENVNLMKESSRKDMQVKASGGIRNLNDFKAMVKAGATRIGTSSGVKIINQID